MTWTTTTSVSGSIELVVTLARPASSSSLKITDRSFRYASPCLWNQLPFSLRKPHSGTSSSNSCSPIPSPITSSSNSPLCTSITPSFFHSRLKTYLFHKSYPLSFTSSSRTASTDFCLHRFFWATRFLILLFSLFFVSGPCARLSWPSRQLLSARKSTVSYRIVSYRNSAVSASRGRGGSRRQLQPRACASLADLLPTVPGSATSRLWPPSSSRPAAVRHRDLARLTSSPKDSPFMTSVRILGIPWNWPSWLGVLENSFSVVRRPIFLQRFVVHSISAKQLSTVRFSWFSQCKGHGESL